MITDFLHEYWPGLVALAGVLFALWFHGWVERQKGYLKGRADALREVYGPKPGEARL